MRHLIDVALRALSPGINDANTAMVVIDRLSGALSAVMRKRLRPGVYRDAAGRPRVVAPSHGYADILEYAFGQIRQSAGPQPAVILRLLAAIERIAEHAELAEQLAALRVQAQLAADEGVARAVAGNDRITIAQGLEATMRRLEAGTAAEPEEAGMTAHAADGAAGLAMMAARLPDLLLVDYQMPGLNGAEVVKLARRHGFGMPVIFATGFANTSALDASIGVKATVLAKPFSLADLKRAIDAALAVAN